MNRRSPAPKCSVLDVRPIDKNSAYADKCTTPFTSFGVLSENGAPRRGWERASRPWRTRLKGFSLLVPHFLANIGPKLIEKITHESPAETHRLWVSAVIDGSLTL